jgi:hypothetical protein
VANGHVQIDGKPAAHGRLSLMPIGGGPRAFSNVDETGAFELRSSTGDSGAFPGSYRVVYQMPVDEPTRRSLQRELAGELAADELSVIYRGPRENPLVIPESGDEDLAVDIRLNQGWTRNVVE